jgi:hypothetical protein
MHHCTTGLEERKDSKKVTLKSISLSERKRSFDYKKNLRFQVNPNSLLGM